MRDEFYQLSALTERRFDVIKSKEFKARKRYKCDLCFTIINPKNTYIRITVRLWHFRILDEIFICESCKETIIDVVVDKADSSWEAYGYFMEYINSDFSKVEFMIIVNQIDFLTSFGCPFLD